jgi:hypothetical protein
LGADGGGRRRRARRDRRGRVSSSRTPPASGAGSPAPAPGEGAFERGGHAAAAAARVDGLADGRAQGRRWRAGWNCTSTVWFPEMVAAWRCRRSAIASARPASLRPGLRWHGARTITMVRHGWSSADLPARSTSMGTNHSRLCAAVTMVSILPSLAFPATSFALPDVDSGPACAASTSDGADGLMCEDPDAERDWEQLFLLELDRSTSAEEPLRQILSAGHVPTATACSGHPESMVRVFGLAADGTYTDVSCASVLQTDVLDASRRGRADWRSSGAYWTSDIRDVRPLRGRLHSFPQLRPLSTGKNARRPRGLR